MAIIKKVRAFVKTECQKPSSKYGYEPFAFHFEPVVKYAKKLANEVGADKEIVQIAAWLHDIGSIIYGRQDHHITGAKIAGKLLADLNYPPAKIKLVQKCILNHRGSINNIRKSKEEQIIAEADAMSHFDNIAGIFKAAFIYENLSQQDAQKTVRKKLQNKYRQIKTPYAKKIIKPKYDAAMLLLTKH